MEMEEDEKSHKQKNITKTGKTWHGENSKTQTEKNRPPPKKMFKQEPKQGAAILFAANRGWGRGQQWGVVETGGASFLGP